MIRSGLLIWLSFRLILLVLSFRKIWIRARFTWVFGRVRFGLNRQSGMATSRVYGLWVMIPDLGVASAVVRLLIVRLELLFDIRFRLGMMGCLLLLCMGA